MTDNIRRTLSKLERYGVEIPKSNPSLNALYKAIDGFDEETTFIEVEMRFKQQSSDDILTERVKVTSECTASRQCKELIKYYNDTVPIYGGLKRRFSSWKSIKDFKIDQRKLLSSQFVFRNHINYHYLMMADPKVIVENHMIGWCEATELQFKPKSEEYIALMVFDEENGEEVWFHFLKEPIFSEIERQQVVI